MKNRDTRSYLADFASKSLHLITGVSLFLWGCGQAERNREAPDMLDSLEIRTPGAIELYHWWGFSSDRRGTIQDPITGLSFTMNADSGDYCSVTIVHSDTLFLPDLSRLVGVPYIGRYRDGDTFRVKHGMSRFRFTMERVYNGDRFVNWKLDVQEETPV